MTTNHNRESRVIINVWHNHKVGYFEPQGYMVTDFGKSYDERFLAARVEAKDMALGQFPLTYAFSIIEDADGTIRKINILTEEYL